MLKYPYLFSPLRVRNTMLKNRIIAAPMGIPRATLISSTQYGGISVFDKSLGGAAVVTASELEMASISHEKYAFNKYARDGSREIVSVLRQSGSLAQIEIGFHGAAYEDGAIEGPSNGRHFTGGKMREMTREEMKVKIDDLCRKVSDAKNFGFDITMLHFGHDSLCSIFLSPVWNQRTDEYGGSVENRGRFAREALAAVRKAVGPEYPLLVRVSRQLMVQETYTEEDMLSFIKSVEDYVDIINISAGMDCYGGTIENYTANTYTHTTIFAKRMYNLDFCEKVKKLSKVLVCIVGGVSDPKAADELIGAGKADAVMLGRQLVADPFWPRKAQEGRDNDIVPCLRCLNCYHISTEHTNVQCSVNPRFRRENRVPLKLEKTASPKKVVVIGGGPAGMKTALTADERGHKVMLLEKSGELGGNLYYADFGDYKADLKRYREYLKSHIAASGVEVRLNTEATYDYVKAIGPDAVIIAVGADFITPGIPGAEYAVQAASVYPKIDEVKGDIVIVGGGAIGSEIALELASRNNNVIVVEPQDALAKNSNWLYRHGLYNAIKDSKCKPIIRLGMTVGEIKKDGVVVKDKNGKEEFLKADHVLLCVGMKSRKDLAASFYGIAPETVMVGDCYRVAQVLETTNDSYFIAANL